jgi:hypothetical protein
MGERFSFFGFARRVGLTGPIAKKYFVALTTPTLINNLTGRNTMVSRSTKKFLAATACLLTCTMADIAHAQDAGDAGAAGVMVRIPTGQMLPAYCVHFMPKGAAVDVHDNVTVNGALVAHYDACPVAPSPGASSGGSASPDWIATQWQEFYYQFVSPSATAFYSTFLVPGSAPTVGSNDNVFVWAGMQSTVCSGCSNAEILQSVLFVGKLCGTDIATGDYYCQGEDSSWQYTTVFGNSSGQFYYTTPLSPNTYDTIAANYYVDYQSDDAYTWVAETLDTTNGDYTYGYLSGDTANWWFMLPVNLEANIDSCSELPSLGLTYTYAPGDYVWTGWPTQTQTYLTDLTYDTYGDTCNYASFSDDGYDYLEWNQ